MRRTRKTKFVIEAVTVLRRHVVLMPFLGRKTLRVREMSISLPRVRWLERADLKLEQA